MLKDLKYALRMLVQTKGWTAVVLISLALGIGANTALFTAVNGLLFQSVGVSNPDALVRVLWFGKNDMVRSSSEYGFLEEHLGENTRATVSYDEYRQLKAANQTLTGLLACAPMGGLNVIKDGSAELASGLEVSGNYFTVLGIGAIRGRTLLDSDDVAGAAPAAVISEAYWKKRFGADPDIAGRVVTINNNPITIVGVIPAAFTGIQRLGAQAPDVTVPLVLDPQLYIGQTRMSQPTYWWLQLIGRLKPGVSYAQVKANLEPVFQNAARAGMDSYMAGLTTEERQLSSNKRATSNVPQLLVTSAARGVYDLDTTSSSTATILGVVVGVVLLIVCANVANLLLSRATSRRKEISIRLSMGASRGRLIRQLLTESLVLSTLGGGLGVLVGYWSRQLLPFGQTTPIDWRVFAFVAGVSVLTGITFGLMPALRATRVELAGAMKDTSRSVTGGRTLLTKGLVIVQVALSLVLVIGAGLFLRTLQNLRSVDVGFNPDRLLMFRVDPRLNRYEADRILQLYSRLNETLDALPGVRSASFTRVPLLSGSVSSTSMYVEGSTKEHNVNVMSVSPDFFDTMEIRVVRGRAFSDRDVKASPKVGMLNERAARELFGSDDPIGRRIGGSPEKNNDVEVVGIVRDTKYNSIREQAPPTFYQCYLQMPPGAMMAMVRTASDPSALTEAARKAVREVDAALPITNVSTQTDQIALRMANERLFATAYSLFGALAVILACVGLFGVMSYSVARRTNEIGIRMALGAQRVDVARMVLGESLLLVVIGIAMGLGAALAAGGLIATKLFGLAPTDPITLVGSIVLMVVVATLAGYVPARRASRVDPLVALRYE